MESGFSGDLMRNHATAPLTVASALRVITFVLCLTTALAAASLAVVTGPETVVDDDRRARSSCSERLLGAKLR